MLPPDFIIHNRYRIIYAADERPGSKVYRGREDQTGRLVLIAALPYEDDTAREDLELLGRQVTAVRHEGLLPIMDQFSEQGTFYLVCHDPGGQDLERVLRARGAPLVEADTLNQARQLLDTIALLHSQHPPIYLGDPSPADLWIGEDGTWRLAPFALIRRIGHAPSPYRAPELVAADAEPTSASDLYALNALLYQAITGWAPPSPEQQQAGTPLNGPRVLNPALSTLAEQVLLRGLQLRAENRYQAAREMSLALETVQMMDGRSLGAGPNVVPTAAPAPRQGPPALPAAPIEPGVLPPAAPVGAYSVAPPAATLPPGPPPYQLEGVPVPGPKRRFSTGCMIALAVALTLLAVGICIGLALVIPGSPLSAWLAARGNAPFATDTPLTAAPAGQAPTAAVEQTAEATAITPASGEPTAAATASIVELGPNAITLQTAGQITQTDEITGVISGPVAYAPDGKTLAIGISNAVNLRDAETLDDLGRLEGHTGHISVIVWSPDNKLLASGAVDDPIIRLWDPATGDLVHQLTGHSGWIRSMAFSPDGSLLASGSNDQTIRLWDPASGTERQTLKGHSAMIGGVVFSPDSTSLASGSRDGTVRLWDVATGRERSGFTFQTELNPAPLDPANPRFWTTGVAFSPDGKTLAVGATDGLIYLLDAATGRELRQLQGHTGWVVIRGVVFSPDGKTLATASLDGTIRLWDPATGIETGTLRGHRLQILSISFSPDGERLASTSDEEGQMLIWDVAQQQVGNSLRIGQGLVTALAFSVDGGVLGMIGYNGTLRLYEIELAALTLAHRLGAGLTSAAVPAQQPDRGDHRPGHNRDDRAGQLGRHDAGWARRAAAQYRHEPRRHTDRRWQRYRRDRRVGRRDR